MAPLFVIKNGDSVLNQIYFNTGTYRHCWTHAKDGLFSPSELMSILVFYKTIDKSERKGRDFEFWNGNLSQEG
jgi:hypothetical protein